MLFSTTRAKRPETCPKSLDLTWCNPSLLEIGYKKRLRPVKVQRSGGVQPAHWFRFVNLFQLQLHRPSACLEQDQLMEKEPYDKERKTIMRRAAVLPRLDVRCVCRQLKTTLKMKIPRSDCIVTGSHIEEARSEELSSDPVTCGF